MPFVPINANSCAAAVLGPREVHRFGDIDEQAAALNGWHQLYLQLSPGRFEGTVQRRALDGVGLFIEDLRQSVHQTGFVREDIFAIGIPLVLEGEAQFCGQQARGDTLHVFSGSNGFEFHSPQRHVMIGIEIDRPLFSSCIDQVVANSHLRRDVAGLHTSGPAVLLRLRRFLMDLFNNADVTFGNEKAFFDTGLLAKHIRTQLLDLVAVALAPNEHTMAEIRLGATAAQRALVARVTEYVSGRLGDPPSVGEMCVALCVSRRTLQTAFQSCWGMGPLTWLTTMRLNAVRRRLKTAQSVTEAATEFGFWHFGHFASDYHALFGECPSHTLRHHRRACPAIGRGIYSAQ